MESIWRQTTERPYFPVRQLPEKAEAAVIGAGMAGVLTAWLLQRQGVQTILLDADRAGGGQTEKTTAKITFQHGLIYDRLIRTVGEEAAEKYLAANKKAVKEYRRLIDREKIDCDFQERSSYLYSVSEFAPLEREMTALHRLGASAQLLAGCPLPFPVRGALRVEKQAQFHPLKFLYALAGQLDIYEKTPVLRVEDNVLHTSAGKIKAEQIIFACHYPFPLRPGYYFARMHQERSYVLAVDNVPDLNGIYYGIDNNGLSFRNYGPLLLVGGGSHRCGENTRGGQYEMLSVAAKNLWPDCRERAMWSAQDCMTLDDIPYIGRFTGKRSDWYVATGFKKWGMTGAMVSAKLISDGILGKVDPESQVFSPRRLTIRASAGNFVNEGVHSIKNLTRYYLPFGYGSLQKLKPGCGSVIIQNEKKMGAYKDQDGYVYLVSAKCPHMGCQLVWNPDEKSWDCPCHGSRFDHKGRLLDGPAQTGIGRKK